MGGKPSLLLPGTAGTKSALWQGGKQPLGDAEGGFFDEWRIGAAVSLGVACVDQQKHPSVGKRLRLPVADEPGAADALRDRLDVANVGRHVCDASDLGRRKTAAMADRIRARNPAVRIDTIDADILDDPDQTREWLEGVDAIVAATDNNPSRLLLNRIAVETGTPVVFGRAFVRASGGDVIRVRPQDPDCPCYSCLIGERVEEEEITSARSSAAPAYADRPVRAEPGLSLDIAPIAHFCARLVLQELLRGTDSGLRSLEEDLPGSLFLWANRREGRFAQWPVMGASVRSLAVQRWYGVRARRNPACETCNPDAFLDALMASVDADAARLTG